MIIQTIGLLKNLIMVAVISVVFPPGLCSAVVTPSQSTIPAGGVVRDQHRISITIDDLPAPYDDLNTMRYVRDNLIPRIVENNIPVVGFVNEYKLYAPGEIDERVAILERWVDAGIELGNHTFSHIRIDNATIDEYTADVIRGETVISWLLGRAGKELRYFRHPYLRTGPSPDYKAAVDGFLHSRGYTAVPVTMDNDEYIFAAIYHTAKQKGDSETMSRVAADYLLYMSRIADHFEKVSMEFLDRNIDHILLLHANELNADYFCELVGMLREKGYVFISIEDTLSDPAYALPEACSPNGISWLYRWMLAAGEEPPDQPRPPEAVMKLFNRFCR